MSKVALSGNASGTGTFTIASPNSNVDRTINLPDSNGTILTTATAGVPVNGPAFSAYQSSAQAISANTVTKVLFQTEHWDTASCFASSRFTPTVAGYYQINASVQIDTSGWFELMLYKNGAAEKTLFYSFSASVQRANGSCSVYLNGSTDYVEIYARQQSTTNISASSASVTWFDGALIRSAT